MNQQILIDRELGIYNFRFQQTQYLYELIRSIDLSVKSEFIPQNNGPINCLDIDQSENRYLICGGADGLITVFDLLENYCENVSSNSNVDGNGSKQDTKRRYNPILKIKRVNINRERSYNAPISLARNSHRDDVNKLFKGVQSIQWYSNDTGMFFTGSVDGSVEIWDTNSESVSFQFDLEYAINCISYPSFSTTNNRTLLAVASTDQKARLVDFNSKTTAECLTGHREGILSIKWSPTHPNLIVTGSKDKTIRLWDIRRAQHFLMALDQHHSDISGYDLSFVENASNSVSDRSQPKFSQTFQSKVKKTSKQYSFLKNMSENQLGSPNSEVKNNVPTAHNGFVTSLAWTPDGQYLISTGNDNKIHLWDMMKGVNTFIEYPKSINTNKTSNQIALSRGDGKYLFHPNGKGINVYDTKSGQLVNSLKGHFEKVNCCIYHPTDEVLFSGSNDKLLLSWDNSQHSQNEENEFQQNFKNLKNSLVTLSNVPTTLDSKENEYFIDTDTINNTNNNNNVASTTLPDEDRWDD